MTTFREKVQAAQEQKLATFRAWEEAENVVYRAKCEMGKASDAYFTLKETHDFVAGEQTYTLILNHDGGILLCKNYQLGTLRRDKDSIPRFFPRENTQFSIAQLGAILTATGLFDEKF